MNDLGLSAKGHTLIQSVNQLSFGRHLQTSSGNPALLLLTSFVEPSVESHLSYALAILDVQTAQINSS
jgi:hypothetical protein